MYIIPNFILVQKKNSPDGVVRVGLYVHHDFYDPTTSIRNLILHNTVEVAGIKDGSIPFIFHDDLNLNLQCLGLSE